jgi:hypothetical protein
MPFKHGMSHDSEIEPPHIAVGQHRASSEIYELFERAHTIRFFSNAILVAS